MVKYYIFHYDNFFYDCWRNSSLKSDNVIDLTCLKYCTCKLVIFSLLPISEREKAGPDLGLQPKCNGNNGSKLSKEEIITSFFPKCFTKSARLQLWVLGKVPSSKEKVQRCRGGQFRTNVYHKEVKGKRISLFEA